MKRLVSICVSLAILALIYWKIDLAKLLPVFVGADPVWMAVSLAMVVPLTLATAWRLCQLMPARGQLGFIESNKLILVASVLNLVLPSKMGDIAKAWFMRERGAMSGGLALALVVFEKTCDMLSLLWWCVFGLVWVKASGSPALAAFRPPAWMEELLPAGTDALFWLAAAMVGSSLALGTAMIGSRRFARVFFAGARKLTPGKVGAKVEKVQVSWEEMHGYFWASKGKLALVAGTSVFIWFLHLLQIWLFILAIRESCPFVANLALSPLAILAGLLPLTFAGVGTRDAALILFYAPYFSAPQGAALGILCTARYLLPALGGMPFAGGYFAKVRTHQQTA